ncbi:maleylacetate reductase (plasmid) [Agrobacterium sp. rho-13.3]|uniref:maleylacetate reductase n=1 Tax=Agrobacterium sp. rho-13.3 TaxID=3072980 RepID=UPI002A1003B9|nr:maleylacetate reductase [Agrobacterium sp. rho-13.3]MDX8312039.1 maleylacetate reductase [Agrobacterium sp. rho-13.3]
MSARDFVFQAQPNRIVFGSGTIKAVREEAARLGMSRVVVLSTPHQRDSAEIVLGHLADLGVGTLDRAVMHTPTHVTAEAARELEAFGANGVVSIGGGSAIGLGKALSVRTGLAHLAIPTTYAGSEMTSILGETENGIKTTRRDPAILPATTIYDVDLTIALPAGLSATSGMNAIAHAVEALYAPDGNPIISLMAEDAISSFAKALPILKEDLQNLEARQAALYGAWLAGTCLGSVSMSIHHKLCHTLGGTFDLPHAETHSVILPYATSYVSASAPEAMKAISRACGSNKPAAIALQELGMSAGAPTALKDIGMPKNGLDRAADLATANPYWSPRPLVRDDIRDLLERAFTGSTP